MKKVIIVLSIFFLSSVSVAKTIEKYSDNGFFIIKIQAQPDPPVVGQDVTLTVTIYDSHSKIPVVGAKVEVIPWMTAHSHGSSKRTRTIEKGNGVYTIEDVYFTMEGDWDLLINIRKNNIEDRCTVTLKDIKK